MPTGAVIFLGVMLLIFAVLDIFMLVSLLNQEMNEIRLLYGKLVPLH